MSKRKSNATITAIAATVAADADLTLPAAKRVKAVVAPRKAAAAAAAAAAVIDADADSTADADAVTAADFKFDAKEREPGSAPHLAVSGLTAFQKRVYALCKRVPRGYVATYSGIAAAIGGNGSRAVGSALKGNPFAPVVPCHRVVRADLTLGGFCGATDPQSLQLQRKVRMLRSEGVKVITPDDAVKGKALKGRGAAAAKGQAKVDPAFVFDLSKVKLTAAELDVAVLARADA